MRVLAISADRSKRGVLYPSTPAFKRQEAYARAFGSLDIVGFSLKSDGAKFLDVGQLRIYPTNSASKFLWWLGVLRIARTLPKFDVVSVQDPFETGLVGWWIAWKYKIPLHVQVHTDFLSPEYAKLSFVNQMRARIAKFVLKRASGIRIVSRRIKASLEAADWKLAPIVSVLPIFVDIDRVRGAADASITSRFSNFRTRVLVVSRLEPEKNVSLALSAFARSAPENACLVIIGGGSERAKLEGRAAELRISSRTFFEGEQRSAPYYYAADIVLVPSKYEGYGLVTVEALSTGKPVLSTDVGIAREAGAIVTTEEKFADALAEWFKNGPRTGELKGYPYKNFEEYVRAYCDDIAACASGKKTQ